MNMLGSLFYERKLRRTLYNSFYIKTPHSLIDSSTAVGLTLQKAILGRER